MNENRTSIIKQQSCALLLAAIVFLGAGAAWGQQAKDSLVGNWVKVSKAKFPEANLELLSDGTGKSGTTPITWKLDGSSLVVTKTVNKKETATTYSYSLSDGRYINLRDDESGKYADYQKKEWAEEIARVKKEAKQSVGSFTDARDKKKYKSVKINGKTWMAANLNFKADSSWCYENKEANCTKYGRLYTWTAAKTACPEGWSLPKKEEAEYLFKVGGYEFIEVKPLKSKTGWPQKLNGTDELFFSALPGGFRDASGGFDGILSKDDAKANWWVDIESEKEKAQSMYIHASLMFAPGMQPEPDVTFGINQSLPKGNGLSVRCVQD